MTTARQSLDIADAGEAHLSQNTSVSDEEKKGKKDDIDYNRKSPGDFDGEKKPNNDTATTTVIARGPLRESQPKSRRLNYARSLRDFFSVGTIMQCIAVLVRFGKFTGPGTIIAVAYIDPDNFQTAITSGANFEFKLLCMILVANLTAIFLQSLSVKLGSVTGMDLAQMNRAYLPRWLNIALWVIAEASIVATDVGQVIGTAIAINILNPNIPLVAGCIISAADTLIILIFYRPDGSLRGLRLFELFVTVFVLGVFISFCIELSYVSADVGEVFKGYLPSRDLFVGDGLYQSCAILGGTLMPHTLYLGSGLVQARMRDFDKKNEKYHEVRASDSEYAIMLYRPSLAAIKSCMAYSIAELCITLFIVAVFINSAILIVSAASLSEDAGNADLFGIYDIFVDSISQASGTIFALGLLFSGVSAGIVATLAGQMVAEGAMNWRMSPFFRRLVTRSIAIIPGVIIAAAEGRDGLAAALNGCNVVLSVALIFISFPLVWYTSRNKYMRVRVEDSEEPVGVVDGMLTHDTERAAELAGRDTQGTVSLANNWATTIAAGIIWLIIAGMNIATLVFLGEGLGDD